VHLLECWKNLFCPNENFIICCWWLQRHSDYLQVLNSDFFFSKQPSTWVDIKLAVSSNIISRDIALPLPPPSSTNHGLFMDLHLFVGETTPQSNVVVGDFAKLSEFKKKKPIKVEWEINQIYQD